jgi:hypothetical protein
MTRRLQFSLKTLLIATAILAMAASLLRKRGEERPQWVPVSELGKTHVLVGKTHQPLGEVTTLKGLVFDGASKGYDDGSNVRVQFINGEATQEIIELKLVPCLGSFIVQNLGDPAPLRSWELDHLDLNELNDRPIGSSELKFGHTYEFKGYESGEYVGIPWEAMSEVGLVQTSGFGLHLHYVVASAKEIPAIQFSPEQFVDRQAILDGTAINDDGQAYLVGKGWRLLVDSRSGWPQTMDGKQVAVLSTIRRLRDGLFRADQPRAYLVNLTDQIGQEVQLRGEARSMNDDWWLNYRGTPVHLGTREQLIAVKLDPEYGPAIISGTLTETPIAPNDRLPWTDEKQRGKRYFLHVKSWQPIDSLFSPELPRDQ